MEESMMVTVCDKCLCASCWQGIFMCDEAQNAGVVDKTVGELRALPDDGNREHEDYWNFGRTSHSRCADCGIAMDEQLMCACAMRFEDR